MIEKDSLKLIHAKICIMKVQLPHHEHYSYLKHRRQRFTQIILPVLVAALVMAGLVFLVSFAAFNQGGDVGRWAAISTIWIILPVLVAGLVVLAVMVGMIWLLGRGLGALPFYTGLAQDYIHIARGYVVRAVDFVVRPILALKGWGENVRAFLERLTP